MQIEKEKTYEQFVSEPAEEKTSGWLRPLFIALIAALFVKLFMSTVKYSQIRNMLNLKELIFYPKINLTREFFPKVHRLTRIIMDR